MQPITLVPLLIFAALLAGCGGNSMSHHPTLENPVSTPKRVTGIGGVFFKCKDPEAMKQWYARHLGLQTDGFGTNFEWRQADEPTRKGFTQWAPFRQDTKYFQPSRKDFMINYRVENLDALLKQLRAEGVTVSEVDVQPYGKFCHILDPEGNAIELWEPNDEEYEKIVEGRTK